MSTLHHWPIQGAGIGLRSSHVDAILHRKPNIPWLEALSDNYFHDPIALDQLKHIREHYPIGLHGVGLSLGSIDPLNQDYLQNLKQLANTIQPTSISDHLSWSSVNGQYLHDLLPLPFTEEAIAHVSQRIDQVQDYLGQRIMVENASSYLSYACNEMPEWAFINEIANRSDCHILLDINNLYVTTHNQGADPNTFLRSIDASRVKQYHLAGYSDEGDYLFDRHDQPIHSSVWYYYQKALETVGVLPTLIEYDDHIPPLDTLINEAQQAQRLMAQMAVDYV